MSMNTETNGYTQIRPSIGEADVYRTELEAHQGPDAIVCTIQTDQ